MKCDEELKGGNMKKIKDTWKEWQDNEACLLGCLIIDNSTFAYARKFSVEPEDFKEPINRRLFEAMIHIYYCDKLSINLLTINDHFKNMGWKLDMNYVSHLAGMVPTAANLETYIEKLKGGEK